MGFKVFVSSQAKLDIGDAADYIQERGSAERARRWKDELIDVIESLQEMPKRCPKAAESISLGLEIRELHYYSHRVIFRVIENTNTVQVLRVYHSARAPLRFEDLG